MMEKEDLADDLLDGVTEPEFVFLCPWPPLMTVLHG
jgi:hypothetical protein